jgi:hypothetical protein
MLPLTGAELSVVMLSLRAFGLYSLGLTIMFMPNLKGVYLKIKSFFGVLSPILQVQKKTILRLQKRRQEENLKTVIILKNLQALVNQHLEVRILRTYFKILLQH